MDSNTTSYVSVTCERLVAICSDSDLEAVGNIRLNDVDETCDIVPG